MSGQHPDPIPAVPPGPCPPAISLERQLAEARRYYVCGIIENATRYNPHSGRDEPAPMRWADVFDAESPQQAEDQAVETVRNMVDRGRRGNLWVAGVYQLDITVDGELGDPPFIPADSYAKYVNRDLTDEVL